MCPDMVDDYKHWHLDMFEYFCTWQCVYIYICMPMVGKCVCMYIFACVCQRILNPYICTLRVITCKSMQVAKYWWLFIYASRFTCFSMNMCMCYACACLVFSVYMCKNTATKTIVFIWNDYLYFVIAVVCAQHVWVNA